MVSHYLLFNGNCEEAIRAYEEAFGAKVLELQRYGDMPPAPSFPIAENQKKLVLHARLSLDGTEIMCADSQDRIESGDNMYVSITTKDATLVDTAWKKLSMGGEVYMALAPSFFAAQHGSLRDKFGINWMFTALK